MRAYLLSVFLLTLLSYSNIARGDANVGDLFGYSLGTPYTEQIHESTETVQLVLITAENPVKPSTIDKVLVLVTPISRSIGKIAGETWYESGEDALIAYEQYRMILRKKYSQWESDETTRQNIHASRFWSGDYELSVRVSGPHSDNPMMPPGKTFQFLITLIYKPSTSASMEFEKLADAEIKQSAAGEFSEDEIRGL